MAEDLQILEELALVSRVLTELDNHLGINDKVVAEFIIDIAGKNPTFDKFKKAMSEQGLDVSFKLLCKMKSPINFLILLLYQFLA